MLLLQMESNGGMYFKRTGGTLKGVPCWCWPSTFEALDHLFKLPKDAEWMRVSVFNTPAKARQKIEILPTTEKRDYPLPKAVELEYTIDHSVLDSPAEALLKRGISKIYVEVDYR